MLGVRQSDSPATTWIVAMIIGSADFDTYAKNLRRIMWAEFIDEQMRQTRATQFRASLVKDPYDNPSPDLAQHFDYHRHRITPTE